MEFRVTIATSPRVAGWPRGAHKTTDRNASFFSSPEAASAFFRHCCSVKKENQSILLDRTATPLEERTFRIEDAYGLMVSGDPIWWREIAGAPFGPVDAQILWQVADPNYFYGPDGKLLAEVQAEAARQAVDDFLGGDDHTQAEHE
jgi:hypothetical protein